MSNWDIENQQRRGLLLTAGGGGRDAVDAATDSACDRSMPDPSTAAI